MSNRNEYLQLRLELCAVEINLVDQVIKLKNFLLRNFYLLMSVQQFFIKSKTLCKIIKNHLVVSCIKYDFSNGAV